MDLKPPPPDILSPVVSTELSYKNQAIQGKTILHDPGRRGQLTRVTTSLATVLLISTAALVVSGANLDRRARDEPVQIPAGALFDRAERTYQLSWAMGVTTAVFAVAALVCYWSEGPARGSD